MFAVEKKIDKLGYTKYSTYTYKKRKCCFSYNKHIKFHGGTAHGAADPSADAHSGGSCSAAHATDAAQSAKQIETTTATAAAAANC